MCNDNCSDITYSSRGPQGDRGATGATGATGPKGDQGDPGPSGGLPDVTPVTGASATLNGSDSGTVLLKRSSGSDIALPTTPADGTNYSFQTVTDPTTGSYVIYSSGGDIIQGAITSNEAGASPVLFTGVAGTETALTLNGSTTGGLLGTKIDMIYTNGVWQTSGYTQATGARITPFG